jgi:DNA mismatch repair protein MutH
MLQDNNYLFIRKEFDRNNRLSVIKWAKWLQGRTLWDSYNLLSLNQKKELENSLQELRDNINAYVEKGNYKGDKGIIGQLLELVHYGLARNSRNGCDIPECELELKATGIKFSSRTSTWSAKERLTLEQLNYEKIIKCSAAQNSGWEPKGLSDMVLHVYFYSEGPPFNYNAGETVSFESMMRMRFAGSFAWEADIEMMELAYYDWRLIKAMCESGYSHMISERYSQFLGCAPRGLGSRQIGREAEDYSAQTVEEAQGLYKFENACKKLSIKSQDIKKVFEDITKRQLRPRDKKYGFSLPPLEHHNVEIHGKYPKQKRAFTIPPSGLSKLINENLKLPNTPVT